MFLKIKFEGVVHLFNVPEPETEEFTIDGMLYSKQLCVESDTAIALKDRDGAHIPVEHLLEIIKQFKGCSCFYVEVFIYPESSTKRELIDVETAINSKSLEKYIKEGDYGCIFEKYSAKSTLCDRTRRNLVREATNFLRKICGNHPKRQEKIALAELGIALIPQKFKI